MLNSLIKQGQLNDNAINSLGILAIYPGFFFTWLRGCLTCNNHEELARCNYEVIISSFKEFPQLLDLRDRANNTVLHEILVSSSPILEYFSRTHTYTEKGMQFVLDILKMKPELINASNELGQTPLHVHLHLGNKEVPRLIMSPLLVRTDTDITRVLIENGANVGAVDHNGRTPLHYACQLNNRVVLNLLIKNGADVNVVDKDGNTPLHICCFLPFLDLDIAKLLIDSCAKVNMVNRDGRTPLHLCLTFYPYLDLLKLFIENGADVDVVDKDGNTPLALILKQVFQEKNLKNLFAKEGVLGSYSLLITLYLDNRTTLLSEEMLGKLFESLFYMHRLLDSNISICTSLDVTENSYFEERLLMVEELIKKALFYELKNSERSLYEIMMRILDIPKEHPAERHSLYFLFLRMLIDELKTIESPEERKEKISCIYNIFSQFAQKNPSRISGGYILKQLNHLALITLSLIEIQANANRSLSKPDLSLIEPFEVKLQKIFGFLKAMLQNPSNPDVDKKNLSEVLCRIEKFEKLYYQKKSNILRAYNDCTHPAVQSQGYTRPGLFSEVREQSNLLGKRPSETDPSKDAPSPKK